MANYEESRNQRLEENKRRMEELGLVNLAQDLKKPKVVRKKPEKRKIELHEARRSSRVAAKPVVVYREQLQRVKGSRERNGRAGLRGRYLTAAARQLATEAAEELEKDIENPAFVKSMLHSHTSSVFWLGLPEDFCKEHMPVADEKFMLEDEKEKEWECTYLAQKRGLSGGWRGFAVDHDVMDGDCCVFELVSPGRFKVHIVRFEDEPDEESDDSDGKKPRSRKARRVSRSKKFVVGDDEDDEDDEDEEDEEEDEEEEEFDSDVCDDHVSEEEEEEEEVDDEDSEGDYSPKLSEKEVDTLVATSRASRVAKRKIVKVENDDSEEEKDDA